MIERSGSKNYSSRAAFPCRLLPRDIAWALTGTPIEKSRSDIKSIFSFLHPGLVPSGDGKAKLLSAISPYVLRRRKAEVLADLPRIIVQDMVLELAEGQRCAYNAAWQAGSMAFRQAPHPASARRRSLQGRASALLGALIGLLSGCWGRVRRFWAPERHDRPHSSWDGPATRQYRHTILD